MAFLRRLAREIVLRGTDVRVVGKPKWPPKTVSKLEFTPEDRKKKERILEWAEML